ncbi:MAG: glycosyltransferase family 2 protein [Myxococcota bacterium]
MKPCFLIPCFDHGVPLRGVLESLAPYALRCLVIDDGSASPTQELLARAERELPNVHVQRLPTNRGKGVALAAGYRLAAAEGFTHALQLDADGQHDVSAVPAFLEAMQKDPDAIVLGYPIFDESAPLARIWARQLSRAAVWLATLSLDVHDPLCGMRGVPLALALRVLDAHAHGPRMEFDPEFAVTCVWAGAPVANVPVRVSYPTGGLSHFDIVRDYPAMAATYARLWGGMLVRAPRLVRARDARVRARGAR